MNIDKQQMKLIIEGALFAAGQPLPIDKIAELLEEEDRPSKKELQELLAEMQEECTERAIELKQLASGYCFQVKQQHAPYVSKLWQEKPARYSRALLETLAIVAYRQPVTRADIEEIRGVAVSTHIIRTLEEREWVKVIGHRDVPGKPAIFGTTKAFLDYFNLKSLDELPSLQEIKDLDQLAEKLNPQLELEVAQTETSAQEPAAEISVDADAELVAEAETEIETEAVVSDEQIVAEAETAEVIEHPLEADNEVTLQAETETETETEVLNAELEEESTEVESDIETIS